MRSCRSWNWLSTPTADRLRELSAKPYVKYVSIFRNHGQQAGASLSHAHSQVIATPIVPTLIQEEMEASKAFYPNARQMRFLRHNRERIKKPKAHPRRRGFCCLSSFASINPMEFWIIPKKHAANILSLDDAEVSAFAKTLKSSLAALKELVNDPPYNYGFHLAPKQRSKRPLPLALGGLPETFNLGRLRVEHGNIHKHGYA